MADSPDFEAFEKIPRLNRGCVITEKIDGTNAQVVVLDNGAVLAGSRKRWIKPGDDNFGFAAWVEEHADELRQLGPGRHYGEWWGLGIQRGYGLDDKRFSLFNVSRWRDPSDDWAIHVGVPACCDVVPVLYSGPFSTIRVHLAVERLTRDGSVTAPGFMRPEGVIVWHEAARQMFKVTCEGDEKPKGSTERG